MNAEDSFIIRLPGVKEEQEDEDHEEAAVAIESQTSIMRRDYFLITLNILILFGFAFGITYLVLKVLE
jgi:hypothetical protein